ncbi:MAG: recombinase family protein, partial [Ruminococcus sp.]|nr:recombinase family protein [Ruminococcus sp.]
MIYGYCRISTPKQSIDRQIRNILALYPKARLIKEAYTGTTKDRPEWNKLYKRLKTGDTVVFDSISRMSRNADDGLQLYQELYNKGIELVFIKEPYINTSTYRNEINSKRIDRVGNEVDIIISAVEEFLQELVRKQVRIAFKQAEKEVQDLRQRTREGLETARLNGKQIGNVKGVKLQTKKSIKAKETIRKHAKEFGGSLNDLECIALIGIARNSYYKYK